MTVGGSMNASAAEAFERVGTKIDGWRLANG
jgi:hypothetical protein